MKKEVKITPPEGYEIDKENSTFENIVFKEKQKQGRWKPERGEEYYAICAEGDYEKLENTNHCVDKYNIAVGHCFKTKEEANEYAKKLIFNQKVLDRIAELNEGWEPDWDNKENKFSLYVNNGCLMVEYWGKIKNTSDKKHFKSRQIGEQIIKEFDNDKLIKFFI